MIELVEHKIVIGAPVAQREQILPLYFSCIAQQTIQPDYFCFVYSDSQDDTLRILEEQGARVARTRLPYHSRGERNADPKDPHRAHHMAALRNQLRAMFLATDADIFISLDTDILLEDPRTIERLVSTLDAGWDTASPLLYLHPLGAASKCYNAGWWRTAGADDPDRVWERATENDVRGHRSPVKVDIPMAAVAMRRRTLAMCRYQFHTLGEDMGFANSLDRHDMRCAWLTDLEARHVMDLA